MMEGHQGEEYATPAWRPGLVFFTTDNPDFYDVAPTHLRRFGVLVQSRDLHAAGGAWTQRDRGPLRRFPGLGYVLT